MNEKFDLKNPQHLVALFLVVFILLTIPLTVISVLTNRDQRSQAANTTRLYLQPSSQNVNVGADLVVNVREDSGTTQVTTADIQLTYDQTKLDFISMDAAVLSDFQSNESDGFVAPKSIDETTGKISFVRWVQLPNCDALPPGSCPSVYVTGDKLIATIRFKALQVAGVTPINFASTSNIQSADGDETITPLVGGNYTIVDQSPNVSLTAPAAGAFVKGNAVTVSADATDNIGVVGVEFYDGGTRIGLRDTTATGNSYSVSWNTTLVAEGSHTLTARAFDLNGSNISAPVIVTVDNTPPSAVTLSGLAAKVKGSVTITGTATDTNLDRIEFRVDSGAVTADNTSPYTYTINTALLTNTSHTLTATAYDKAGTAGTSTNQTFTVDNLPPSAPVLSGIAISETQIDLSWTASTDTQSGPVVYDVYRNGSKLTLTPQSTTTYSATGLTSATTYNFTVKAIDAMGNPQDSNILPIATKSPPKEGDINLDGKVGPIDLAILIATWGSTTDLRADINRDGKVASADLARLISRWGS